MRTVRAGADFFLPPYQMTAQGTAATSLEASVIAVFNTKLAASIASFKANNTGVRVFFFPSEVVGGNLILIFMFTLLFFFFEGGDVALGRQLCVQRYPE